MKAAEKQPTVTKFRAQADGIEVWHTYFPEAGAVVPQHAHVFPHITVFAAGGARVFVDDVDLGEFWAPSSLYVEAGKKHLFLILENDTAVDCIHNVSRRGEVEIAEEHQIVGES